MAIFETQSVTLELSYIVGQKEDGAGIYKKSTLRHIHDGATPDALLTVAQAIASLSSYTLAEVTKGKKQLVL